MQKAKWDGRVTINLKKVFITLFWLLTIAFWVNGFVTLGNYLGSHEIVVAEKLVSPLITNK